MVEIKITGTNFADCKQQANAMFNFLEIESGYGEPTGIPAHIAAIRPSDVGADANPTPAPAAKAPKATKPAKTKKEMIAPADDTSVTDIQDIKQNAANANKPYTEVDARAAAGKVLSHFSSKGEDGIAPLQKLLKQFSVMKAVEVPAEKRADFIEACEEACS